MIYSFQGRYPQLSPGIRAADNASISGNVALSSGVNVWYGAVVRGDESFVQVGSDTNVQDNAVLHGGVGYPLTVGRKVTVGHGAIVHGCTVEDGCLIGMGAILLNGCTIGEGSLVAAGALVTQGKEIPPRSLVMGAPAKVIRTLSEEEAAANYASAEEYLALAQGELPLLEAEDGREK